jgi:hypothetical protein
MLAKIHAAAACAWLGVVAAEAVLELLGRDQPSRRFVAKAHLWIDYLFEGPLVVVVLVTGGILLARAWPAPPLLLVKACAGLIAVIANGICMPLVWMRVRAKDDAQVQRLFGRIRLTGLAIPFGLAALVLGIVG